MMKNGSENRPLTHLIEAKLLADDASLIGQNYLWKKSNGYGYHPLGGSDDLSWSTASTNTSYKLRPVAVATVTK